MPVAWSYTTNIYEVNVRQYTAEGTFAAFQKHLPRLKEMGIKTLWFMPLTPIALQQRLGTLGSYYACADYTSINPEFGTAADFKLLVAQAHLLGFKVIIDWVANHTGFGHTWAQTNPDYYLQNTDGTYLMQHGWEDVIHLNYANKNMRQSMIEAMQYWHHTFAIDGYRCDMAHLVPLDFWQQAQAAIDPNRNLFWLAECEEPNYHPTFDATYSWKLLHTLESYCKRQIQLEGIQATLNEYATNFANGFKLNFTSNHDENSHSGSEYERLGNAALPMAILTCTWQGIPLIYSGQEAANKKRILFFDKDFIDWSNHYLLHFFYKNLLELSTTNSALSLEIPAVRITTDNENKLFAYKRTNGEKELVVLLNLSDSYYWAHLTDATVQGCYTNVFTKETNNITVNRYFEMKPWGYYVYEK
jgi:alpha-amylase